MIFVDFTQASKGEARADAQAFKNLNALIAADTRVQQANEFFVGAPGRIAATTLESDRQVGLADTLRPDLQSIIAADANQILGQAATRSIAGQLAQQTAAFTLPEIPTLAGDAVGRRVADSRNSLTQSTVLTPQQQQIAQNQNTQTLSQQPVQFAYEAGQNQFALDQQPLTQQVQANNLRLQADLQAGEREYQLAYQDYQNAILSGKQADLPTTQRLQRAQTQLSFLQNQYNQITTRQNITDQPAAARLATVQRELAQMQAEAAQRNLPLDEAYNNKVREYNTLLTQANITNQPLRQQVTNTQLTGQANRAITNEQIADTNQDIALSTALFSKGRTVDQQNIIRVKDQLALGQLEWEQLSQENQLAIQTDQLVVDKFNTAQAIKYLPAQAKLKAWQSGKTLAEAAQEQKNRLYVQRAEDIKTKAAPDAAEAAANEARFKAQAYAGIRALQVLDRYDPTQIPLRVLTETQEKLVAAGLMEENSTFTTGPSGVLIQNTGQEPRPVRLLQQALISEVTPAPKEGKPVKSKFTSKVWWDDDKGWQTIWTLTSPGIPTPEDKAELDRLNAGANAPAPAAAGVASLIGDPAAARQQLEQSSQQQRGY